MILIYPPVAKPCEPPAGIARLSGMLADHGVRHRLLDANIEGLLYLLGRPVLPEKSDSAWTKRAFRNYDSNLSSLREAPLYRNPDRYSRAVKDIGRVLSVISPSGTKVSIVNYDHDELSPLRSGDLLAAAERPELNPYYPFFRSRIEELFREKEPLFVGISLTYLSQALSAFSMIGFIRREFPGVKVIMGGGLVTSWVTNLQVKNPFSGLIDHVVSGPGEYQLLSILGLKASDEETWRPDYNVFPRTRYLSPGFILPYSASMGCYWNRCSFCPEKAEGNQYIPIPAGQVVSDLKYLTKKTAPVLIHFLDNAISPALFNALLADNAGIPWYGFARIDQHLADPDFCMSLKKSGCVMLKLGIESGDQAVLDALGKGIMVEMSSRVLKNLKKAGIATYVYLLFGTHAETEARAEETLAFTIRHGDSIDFLNLAIFNMPLCGKRDPEIETKGFYAGDLSLYTDFIHPGGWDRKSVRQFLDTKFKRHPAVSAILKHEPPVFTSNHAPFFVMGHGQR
ncbi:MAG: radical SAM protein [Syntrophales bacterium LBB04]|nr:radical SAM protein [Syntrophales bacterium LBB04]